MSYDGNDLGYETGYDSDFIRPASRSSTQSLQPQFGQIVYFMIGESDAVTAYKPPVQTLVDPDPKWGGKVMAYGYNADKKAEILHFDSKEAATKAGYTPLQVRLEGKQGNRYLVQYLDEKNNPIKYDQVDAATAKKLQFTDQQLKDAPVIKPDSYFAKQENLKGLEKSNKPDPNKADLPTDVDAQSLSVGAAAAQNNEARWKEGGTFYDRLHNEYSMSDNEVKFIQDRYGSDSKRVDELFPPLTNEQKLDPKLRQAQIDSSQRKVMDDVTGQQARTLESNVNANKGEANGKGKDVTRMDAGEGDIYVRQLYRDSGFNIDGKTNFKQFVEVQGSVNDKVSAFKNTSAAGKVDPALTATKESALRRETDGLVADVAAQMPDKITVQENGKDKTITLKPDDKTKYAQVYVQKQKEEGRLGSADAVKKFRDEFKARGKERNDTDLKAYAEGLNKGPEGQAEFSRLQRAAGIREDSKHKFTGKAKEAYDTTLAQSQAQSEAKELSEKREAAAMGVDVDKPNWRAEWLEKTEGKKLEMSKKAELEKDKVLRDRNMKDKMGWEKDLEIEKEKRGEAQQMRTALFQTALQSISRSVEMMQQAAYSTAAKQQELTAKEGDKLESIRQSIMASLYPQGGAAPRRG